MNRVTRTVLSMAVLLLCMPEIASVTHAQNPKRVALIVGNSNYADTPLRNPSSDADAMEGTLTSLGFEVTKLKDVGKQQLEDAVDDVTRGLSKGDTCFIFFAGHGMQMDGQNYLVPVGASIDEPQHVKQRCVTVSYFLDALRFSDCSLKIVVVDACRNNPFRGFRRSTSGLADLGDAPEGTIVSFSTSPKTAALDGNGENSPYVESLVKVLGSRADEADIVRIFIEASQVVRASTGQKPYLEFDASMPDFFLKRPAAATLPTKPVPSMKKAETKPANSPAFNGVLAGTTWLVEDSQGAACLITFIDDGVLHYTADRGLRKNGTWEKTGTNKVTISINDGFANLEATIKGGTLQGRGTSLNTPEWTWSATLQ
ncbi:MAG: caspase family protein [Planctomycetaceae bacterium]|nr:caspase family protein [Planctomycetaceae bacterium]